MLEEAQRKLMNLLNSTEGKIDKYVPPSFFHCSVIIQLSLPQLHSLYTVTHITTVNLQPTCPKTTTRLQIRRL